MKTVVVSCFLFLVINFLGDRKVKKLVLLVMTLLLCLSLAACTDPEPTDPIEEIDKGNNSFLSGEGVETEIVEIPFN